MNTIDISRKGVSVQGFRGTLRTGAIVFLARKNKKQEFRVAWAGPQGHANRRPNWPLRDQPRLFNLG